MTAFDNATHDPGGKPAPRRDLSLDDYYNGIIGGDRVILSRAITLVESTKEAHRALADQLVQRCLAHGGDAVRIGVTGVPGVGKSCFIEALGLYLLTEQKRKIAVLAIDPSSQRSWGSILGDKTRMQELAAREDVFIRPSPSSGTLGGVARSSRETILLCEAAGFNTILIETVGVGQSEITVHAMVDFFLLLVLAGAGDELQGIKRGIMEMADGLVITKADGGNKRAAQIARQTYQNALHLFPPTDHGLTPKVLAASAHNNEGIAECWAMICDHVAALKSSGKFLQRRENQLRGWLREHVLEQLAQAFFEADPVKQQYPLYEQRMLRGEISPFRAAAELFHLYHISNQPHDTTPRKGEPQ